MLTGSNKKNRHTLTAWLLRSAALVVVAALSAMYFAGAVFAEGDESSLTVKFSATSGIMEDEDLKEDELVVDLYQVAKGDKDTVFDTYNLSITADFGDLADEVEKAQVKVEEGAEGEDNTSQWKAITQSAVDLVKSEKVSEEPITGTAGTAITDIEPGLYLVLTHNSLEVIKAKDRSMDSYFTTEEDGKITTIALTDDYEYHFEPQLIFLPAKNHDDETGIIPADTFNTAADWGEWVHEAEIILKPTQIERFGSIRVNKVLTSKESDATFVFEVKADKNGKPTYSNVFTLNFFGSQTASSFTLEKKIPVGSTVTVTEVYEGAGYRLDSVSPRDGQVVIEDSETVYEVTITNRPADGPGGYGILNTFTSDGTDWTWHDISGNEEGYDSSVTLDDTAAGSNTEE